MPAAPRIGLFPGTFDPITSGHVDVISRGRILFDRLIVAIAKNPSKSELFTLAERRDMIERIVREIGPTIEVATYQGLTVDYARAIGATAILRGLRNVADLNFEIQLALTNRAVADIETVFMMADESQGFTSSSLIKQIAAGGDINRLHRLLPPIVLEALKRKKAEQGDHFLKLRKDGFTE